MAKQKTGVQIRLADGAGGMRQVGDLRFESGTWPIELTVPAENAESWMAHLGAEAAERGWSANSMSQLEAEENSGTVAVHAANGQAGAGIEFIWERRRGEELRVRARPSGEPALALDVAQALIEAVSARVLERVVARAHRQTALTYEGLPWRGELWLDSEHRIGPPSKYPDSLLGPQAVMVDAMVEGIGQMGASATFDNRVHELCVFLSAVLGLNIEKGKLGFGWVWDTSAQGSITCALRNIGYIETTQVEGFPAAGGGPPIERRNVNRPGLGPMGIWSDMSEQWVPDDIEQLWASFRRLPRAKREHWLGAGNAHLISRSLWSSQRTASAVFLVIACEALKPRGQRYDRFNAYDVIASLVGTGEAERLRELAFHPQKVRSAQVHRGERADNDTLRMFMNSHFMDPSFDEMLRSLSAVSRICLIEWLRCGGEYRVVRLPSAQLRNEP